MEKKSRLINNEQKYIMERIIKKIICYKALENRKILNDFINNHPCSGYIKLITSEHIGREIITKNFESELFYLLFVFISKILL